MRQRVFSEFRTNERGAVAATYALSLFALVAVAGVAFDYARLAGMDSELQNGADQAALAGATQLSREDGSCARATNAAIALLNNETLLANDIGERSVQINGGTTISISNDACSTPGIVFYEDREKTTVATTDEDANFIEVTVDARIAEYAFTPVVGALNSGNVDASAMAGLGSSICKVPPIMVCHPDPIGRPNIDWDLEKGLGILATGHAPGNSSNGNGNAGSDELDGGTTWSPGNFGFLQVFSGDATNRNAALLRALAYDNPAVECVPIGDNKVDTGNAQGKYDAINTRFGIYDTNGGVLGPCEGGACTKSPNTIMPLNLKTTGGGPPKCGIATGSGKGFQFSDPPYSPTYAVGDSATVNYDLNAQYMGMPRDLCHYTTYDETGTATVDPTDSSTYVDGRCPGGNGRFGDKKWGRKDYWDKVHPGQPQPASYGTMSRYDTYVYELANPTLLTGKGHTCGVQGAATRRVLTIAVVLNCADLSGTSVPVDIDEFVDVFLVEPSIDGKGNKDDSEAFKDSIYMEVIGRSTIAGAGTFGSQQVRRDVPYLIE